MVEKFVRLCLVFGVLLSLVNCGGGGGGGDKGNNTTPAAQTANIVGTVTGSGGLPGVKVSAGVKSTTSDNAGNYKLSGVLVPASKRLVVTFEKEGYATYQRSVMVEANKTYAVAGNMMQYHLSQSIDPTQTQNLIISDPKNPGGPSLATLDLPANSVTAAGNVTVNVAVGDPTTGQGRSIFPGDYMASPDAKSEPDTELESVAFAEITIKDGNKEIKQLANSTSAALTIKLPDEFQLGGAKYGTYDPADSAKNTIEWWSYNETNGSWIREDANPSTAPIDNAAVIDVGGVLYAKGEVRHFSWWNADHPISEHSCFCVRVVDADGNPVQGAMVIAEGVTYNGRSTPVMTDVNGNACVNVKRSTDALNPERVKIYVEQGGAHFIYDVTDAAEGDVTLNELFTPTIQGSTIDGSGQCSQLTNDISMVYAGTITGTVTRAISGSGSGSPVSGLTVYTNFGASAVTDSSGVYSFKVPVGNNVSIFIPGVANQIVYVPDTAPVTADLVVPNLLPVFTNISRVPAGTVNTNGIVDITAVAVDPDNAGLVTLSWSASTGSLNIDSGNTVQWTAPATASTATITITATDVDGGVTQEQMNIIVNEVAASSSNLKVTVKDNRLSDQPVSGVIVALYNTDNKTIANTLTTGADGIADFGDIGRTTGTFAVIFQSLVIDTLESHINSYVGVPMGNFVYYVQDAEVTGDTIICDPAVSTLVPITFDVTGIPLGTEYLWIQPTSDFITPADVPFLSNGCSDVVQTDGNMSLLAESGYYDPISAYITPTSYGFLLDQGLVADSTYSIALDHSLQSFGYTTTPATPLQISFIAADRKGISYTFTQGNQAPADVGSVSIPGEFPVDSFQIFAFDNAQHGYFKNKVTLPQSENFNIPDTNISTLSYSAAGKNLSWNISGTAPIDYVEAMLENFVDNIYWNVFAAENTTSLPVMDLPTMPFAVDTSNLANTFCSFSVISVDYNNINGHVELWNLITSGTSIYSIFDEQVVTSNGIQLGNLCAPTPVAIVGVQSVGSTTTSSSPSLTQVKSKFLSPLKGLIRQ